MYGLEHHIVEISGDVTDAGRTDDEQGKIELLSQWKLEAEFRNTNLILPSPPDIPAEGELLFSQLVLAQQVIELKYNKLKSQQI